VETLKRHYAKFRDKPLHPKSEEGDQKMQGKLEEKRGKISVKHGSPERKKGGIH